MEAGAIEVLTNKISHHSYLAAQCDSRDDNSAWVCALLLAVLFQERGIIRSNGTMNCIPVLASLLRSEELANRYFAAQALSSLICHGSRGTLLSVANSGVAVGLISLLGCAESDISDLLELSGEFSLARNPDQIALERLFRVDDIRVGATSRKAIPVLVDLLKPIPDRPGAPFLGLGLLTQLALECPSNMLESAFGAVNQLVAVLRLGGRNSRYSAAKALENLFSTDHIRNGESARQAIQPLVEILNTGSEKEQHAAIAALVRLLGDNPSRALAVGDAEMSAVDVLCRILSSSCSVELKGNAAELCFVMFGNTRIRSTMAAARCVEPLVSLLVTDFSAVQYSVVIVHWIGS
ncbi:uncharacterized protein A4U43_C03F2700 [Asparagus officinalis]|uniref:Armadillo repeat-containing domain-containing protein n=1 Tax=Asparagus officinalis TaxID=4686 RepID=A0A5P1F8M0_ASPOF|nr:uncharacterized protein A4U43_C03F2700 [Asparagus officinalis]